MTGGRLHVLLSRVADPASPEDRDRSWNEIADEFARMKREWIDPQRLVELAKRYTDENRAGKVEIVYYDHEPDRVKCWSVYRDGGSGRYCDGFTLDEALKAAEA